MTGYVIFKGQTICECAFATGFSDLLFRHLTTFPVFIQSLLKNLWHSSICGCGSSGRWSTLSTHVWKAAMMTPVLTSPVFMPGILLLHITLAREFQKTKLATCCSIWRKNVACNSLPVENMAKILVGHHL